MSHLPYSVWSAPSQQFPDQLEYMLIDPVRGRSISSITIEINPIKRGAISVWYKQDKPNTFSTRLNVNSEWRDSFYRLEGNIIYWRWSFDGVEFPWMLVAQSDVPEWFWERVRRSYERMDSAEQGAAANP